MSSRLIRMQLVDRQLGLSKNKNHMVDSYPSLFSKINISLWHTYPKVCKSGKLHPICTLDIHKTCIRLFKNIKICRHNLYKMENGYNLDITVCMCTATIVQMLLATS
jgi:hypothetical protein